MALTARLAEHFGQRQVLYAGMVGFGLASLGAGLSPDLAILNLFRLLQGAGCAVLYTATAAILVEVMPESQWGRALGLLFAANGAGLALGPVVGGVLVSQLGWRSIFLLNVPLILLSFALCKGNIPGISYVATCGWLSLTSVCCGIIHFAGPAGGDASLSG